VTRDELQVAREARAMTRKEVIGMMAAGVLTMLRAADVLGGPGRCGGSGTVWRSSVRPG
jgi:hypothetical protein